MQEGGAFMTGSFALATEADSGAIDSNGLQETGKMNLPKIFTTPVRLPWRHVLSGCALVAFLAGGLVIAGSRLKPPHFVLNRTTQGGVMPVGGYSWRRASDWLAGRKYAVLTFDDGPYGHGVDERILGVLHKHHAHAIFFLVCSHINETTSHLLDVYQHDGHVIGNHSFDHLPLDQLGDSELSNQVEGCSRRIASLTGHRPFYFRPPFGQTSAHVRHFAEASGMQQMLWNANSQDSWQTKPEQILFWSKTDTEDLSILLMHDRPTTAAVLDQALTELEQRGFQFVLPDQLPAGSAAD
jgi:peptidoglycan/xylan/chitin deacetylase (PgdA/CDA1 family)